MEREIRGAGGGKREREREKQTLENEESPTYPADVSPNKERDPPVPIYL